MRNIAKNAIASLAALLFSVFVIWALGRAFDDECERHSDEHWEKNGYAEEVHQYWETRK